MKHESHKSTGADNQMKNSAIKKIKAIYFDQGGVVTGDRIPLADDGKSNMEKIMEMTGIKEDYKILKERLVEGEGRYKEWGMDSLIESAASEVWPKWMLPEVSKEILAPIAEELTLLYFNSKGHRTVNKDMKHVLQTLKKKGYIVGLISNTWSRPLVHEELEAGGITGLFDTVVLSSETGIRKPDEKIFLDALDGFNLKPENAAYVGDQPNRDVAGPKKAGYGLSIILVTKKLKSHQMEKDEHKPDLIIDSLLELLDIFPGENRE